jgi:hypothetical protein
MPPVLPIAGPSAGLAGHLAGPLVAFGIEDRLHGCAVPVPPIVAEGTEDVRNGPVFMPVWS